MSLTHLGEREKMTKKRSPLRVKIVFLEAKHEEDLADVAPFGVQRAAGLTVSGAG